MAYWKCPSCGVEVPDFDVAHVCNTGPNAVQVPQTEQMWKKPIMIHGYELERTCSACPEQYDVYADKHIVAYFRLRHGRFYASCPDVGGEVVYEAYPEGDGIFMDEERVKYLTEAILAVQEYYINRRWDNYEHELGDLQ